MFSVKLNDRKIIDLYKTFPSAELRVNSAKLCGTYPGCYAEFRKEIAKFRRKLIVTGLILD
jgi:hypothetical protein